VAGRGSWVGEARKRICIHGIILNLPGRVLFFLSEDLTHFTVSPVAKELPRTARKEHKQDKEE